MADTNIDRLVTALTAEFTGEVQLNLAVPAKFTAPSIVVAPGDPFLEPSTVGLITERWEVLVVYNASGPDRNVAQMRDNSLRVRRAVSTVGGHWEQATGPRRATANDSDTTALLANQITFRYSPTDHLGDS